MTLLLLQLNLNRYNENAAYGNIHFDYYLRNTTTA